MQIADLKTSIGWIEFIYPDDSRLVFRTTLNPEILKSIPGEHPEGQLFDLDKYIWKLPPMKSGVTVKVYKEKPEVRDLDEFVNRFI